MVLEAVKFHLHFNFSHLFIFFLPLFTFEYERSAVGFSMWKVENKQFPFKASAGWVQNFKKNQNQTKTRDKIY
jgi:hypothetical protein